MACGSARNRQNTVIYGVFFIEAIRVIAKVPRQLENSQRRHLGACNSSADAPEIDGNVFVTSEHPLKPGDLIMVKVTDSDEYDLYADHIN